MSPERQGESHISFEEIVSNAKEVMLRNGKHIPTLIAEGGKNIVVGQIPDLPPTHGERLELMRFLGQATARSGRVDQLHQVFMVSEGWMSVASEDKPPTIRASQDPDRKEVLIISAIQVKEHKKQMMLLEILRDGDKQVVGLEEFLPDEKKKDESVEVPLLEAFVHGFRLAFRTRYN